MRTANKSIFSALHYRSALPGFGMAYLGFLLAGPFPTQDHDHPLWQNLFWKAELFLETSDDGL